MENKESFILMFKDFEVLSFSISFDEGGGIELIKKLDHFDLAPSRMKEADNINLAISRFLYNRTIPSSRTNVEKILAAFDCKNGLELAFKGHGLSLSDHYWYKKEGETLKYDDINFYTNKWDDSFARAILNQDYEALKNCDLNVPDIVTAGWGVKGWIYEECGPKLYKLGINSGYSEEALGEVLASKIARRLFKEDEVLNYELKKVNNLYASCSSLITNVDEEMLPLSEIIDARINNLYRNKNTDKSLTKDFFNEIKESNIPGLYEFFIKLMCLKDLCFVSDLHFGNISMIRNINTKEMRIAPVYDLGGAFGSTRSGKSIISNANKSTLFMVYFLFSDLDPSWDYSWYDPKRLIGAEDEIRNTLSKSDFYTPELIEYIIEVYQHQKSVLDGYAKANK